MRMLTKNAIAFAVTGLLVGGTLTGCQPKKPIDPLEGYRVAVVDLPPLLELHPDYSKLEQLNDEIELLFQEKEQIESEAKRVLIEKGGIKMEEAVKAAKAKLEAEQKKISDELAGISASLGARLNAEMSGLQAQYEAELKREIEKLAPQAAQQPTEAPPLPTGTEGQVKDYMENLMLVRERNLAAKRLELEKRVGDEIAAKKAEVQGQVAAYEADLSAQYQSERLNLQLTAQNSTDEEAKIAAETRLGEIAAEISSAKAAKEAELEGGFSALRAEKTSAIQGELQAYQDQLQAEIAQKIGQKRAELGGMPAPRPQQPVASGPPPELKAKIAAIESRMKGQLASKQAQLKATMNAKVAEATAKIEKKQDEIQESLMALNAQIEEEIVKGLANLPEAEKKKMEEVDKKIEKVQEERKQLAEAMKDSIGDNVAGIAEEQGQKMVIGATFERDYFYMDESFKDLTERTQVRMQTSEKK